MDLYLYNLCFASLNKLVLCYRPIRIEGEVWNTSNPNKVRRFFTNLLVPKPILNCPVPVFVILSLKRRFKANKATVSSRKRNEVKWKWTFFQFFLWKCSHGCFSFPYSSWCEWNYIPFMRTRIATESFSLQNMNFPTSHYTFSISSPSTW